MSFWDVKEFVLFSKSKMTSGDVSGNGTSNGGPSDSTIIASDRIVLRFTTMTGPSAAAF